MVDLLILRDILDAALRDEMIAELKSTDGGLATVYGKQEAGTVELKVRKVTRLAVSSEMQERLRQRLLKRKAQIETHFGIGLSECEEPQFLRYEEGDYFVAHQDGNTPLIFDDSRHRKVSVVIFLNAQSEQPAPGTYGSGALTFHGSYPDLDSRLSVAAEPGMLVAFRAEVTHEVTPVTHGERYTIVTWFR